MKTIYKVVELSCMHLFDAEAGVILHFKKKQNYGSSMVNDFNLE
jgi:hypothetical protein